MKKLTLNLFFILASLGFTACDQKNKEAVPTQRVLQVEAYKVSTAPFNNEVLTTANIMANEQVDIMAPVAGQVLEIYFKEGQMVNKGDRLIRIDDRQWKAELIGVEASLASAEKDYLRKKELLSIEGSSQEEIDQAFSTVENLKSQREQLKLNIDLANVSAPFSGQLGMRNFSKGAFLKQGDMITTLTEVKQLKVAFSLAQAYATSLDAGKKVAILIDKDTVEASIYAIDPVIDIENRTVNVRALLPQVKEKMIRPGTFAEVLVSTDFIENAMMVPTQAVVPSISAQTVYVYKGGKAERKVVEMGNRTADYVHITSGINKGDTIITTGLLQIKEGMPVQIQSFIK